MYINCIVTAWAASVSSNFANNIEVSHAILYNNTALPLPTDIYIFRIVDISTRW